MSTPQTPETRVKQVEAEYRTFVLPHPLNPDQRAQAQGQAK